MANKEYLCKACRIDLTGDYIKAGFCQNCAEKEIKKIKKSLLISWVFGTVFFLIFYLAIYLVKANYVYDGNNYIGHSASLYINVSDFLLAIAGLSAVSQFIIYFIVFFMPFGHFVKFNIRTSGFETIGVLLFEILISAVSGPFILLWNLYQLIRLNKAIKG